MGRFKIAGKSHWVSVTLESENPHNLKPPEDINAVFTLPISVNNSTHNFLIDSGADVSVLPKFIFQPDDRTVTVQMKSANNLDIKVYGKRTLLFQIEDFYNTFSWTFIVADVNKPILGSDFLAKYKLMVNCSSKKIFRLERRFQTGAVSPPWGRWSFLGGDDEYFTYFIFLIFYYNLSKFITK